MRGPNGFSANHSILSICADTSGNRYVAFWNGSSWGELGGLNALAANGNVLSICSDSSGNVYATGSFKDLSGSLAVSKWNATNRSTVGNLSDLSDSILTMCTDPSGNIFIAGTFINSMAKYYVMKWNGTSWSEVGGLNGLAANVDLCHLTMGMYFLIIKKKDAILHKKIIKE